LILAACCSFLGCQRHSASSNTFQLRVEDVIHSDAVVVLTVHTPLVGRVPMEAAGTVSLNDKNGDTDAILFPANDGTVGDVRITAVLSLIPAAGTQYNYIQKLFRMDYDHGGTKTSCGGPAIYPVPVEERTTLKEFCNLNAAPGTYKIGSPVVIGQCEGKPVTLQVNRSSSQVSLNQ
jgi:hypothetical protein